MRLIGLLITVLIMALLMAFFYRRYTTPELDLRQNVDNQVDRMEQQVKEYNRNLEQQETEIIRQMRLK
jgi:uncharacterized membrane-anchored protein YhcB (DUF1043 family)